MTASTLSHTSLREILHYDPETGNFTWLARRRRVQAGRIAGSITRYGYWRIGIGDQCHYGHRLAWFYVHGEWPRDQIDHINGDRADNRISNLREVDRSGNMQNQRRPQSRNNSGFLGVWFNASRNNFRAHIQLNGRTKYLGTFHVAEEASAAYVAAKRELHSHCTL